MADAESMARRIMGIGNGMANDSANGAARIADQLLGLETLANHDFDVSNGRYSGDFMQSVKDFYAKHTGAVWAVVIAIIVIIVLIVWNNQRNRDK